MNSELEREARISRLEREVARLSADIKDLARLCHNQQVETDIRTAQSLPRESVTIVKLKRASSD